MSDTDSDAESISDRGNAAHSDEDDNDDDDDDGGGGGDYVRELCNRLRTNDPRALSYNSIHAL
jgi:hypothetical protein